MSISGPDDTPPPSELQGLDPKDLLQAGLDTVPPVALPPQPVDGEVTVRVAGPSQPSAPQVELPLPEELTHLLPGGNYHVESFLGQGGMGAVYKGQQVRLKRPVAIKIMRRDMGKDYDFEARFEREAQAMAKLNHPNIVSVIDFGEAGPDYLYIVMELIDGADLMDVIRGGQMTQEMALMLLPQVCDALQFAHDHGIVHRDIKPSNIMLTRDGRVKMCDFGLAKRYDVESSFRTQTGTGMGTPDYAAPEQFDPKANIDHRADIYALGVMIYQMITGQLPRGVWKPPSQRAEISPQWDDIVSRAMQSDPSDRYQQASEVKTDVSSIPLKSGADIPVRKPQSGGEAAKLKNADRNVRVTPKSRAPMRLGIAVCAFVIAAGSFFALRPVGDEVTSLTSKTADNSREPKTSEQSGLVTSTPTKSEALPESDWKPLFTEEEWRQQEKGVREYENEMLHLTGSILKSVRPHSDGGIRSRILFKEKSVVPGLVARLDSEGSGYKFVIAEDGKTAGLNRVTRKNDYQKLAQHRFAKPIKFGDKVTLELHALGNRLVAWVDGTPVIDLHDDGIPAAGSWGIGAGDGWFESVEVQSLPAVSVSASPSLPVSSSSVATATQNAPFINTLGMKFVPVPITGGPTDKRRVLFSVWDVRVRDFDTFITETGYDMTQGEQMHSWHEGKYGLYGGSWRLPGFEQTAENPVAGISWEDAKAFCEWLTKRERAAARLGANEQYRLPSDHEWSCAVGLGNREDPRASPKDKNGKIANVFPWGTLWPPPKGAGNYGDESAKKAHPTWSTIDGYDDGFAATSPVGSFLTNQHGLQDMGGNVWQWCEDSWEPGSRGRVVRGGSFGYVVRGDLLSSCRSDPAPTNRVVNFGFRCVLAPATIIP